MLSAHGGCGPGTYLQGIDKVPLVFEVAGVRLAQMPVKLESGWLLVAQGSPNNVRCKERQ